MNLDEAAVIVKEVINQYVIGKSYWTPQEVLDEMDQDPDDDGSRLVFCCGRVDGEPATNAIRIVFLIGRDQAISDPVHQQRADECIGTLKAARPDLAGYQLRTKIDRVSG